MSEDYANKINTETKQYQKQVRQQLKMQCLALANKNSMDNGGAEDIVKSAKVFYAFART